MRYFGLTASGIKESAAYRTELFFRSVVSLLTLMVMWFVWYSVFSSSESSVIRGFTFPMMITYIAVSAMIKPMMGSRMDFAIEEDVRTGRICNIITKPVSYPIFRLFRGLSTPFVSIFMNVMPISLVCFLLLGVSFPQNPLAFLVSVALGFVVSYLMVFMTGLFSFWTAGSIWGIRLSKEMVSDVMSGSIIPIYFFPDWLAAIAGFLPFQAVYNVPLSIYIGKIAGDAMLFSIGVQVFWILALGAVCFLFWKMAEKKVIVHGG